MAIKRQTPTPGMYDFFGGPEQPAHKPLIVGVGGALNPNSASERILKHALSLCGARGADTKIFAGADLDLPMYSWPPENRTDKAKALVTALREADGILLCSPCYHGTISGLLKNAIDYVQDMADDEMPYFEGRAVGLIAVAGGWQATGTTLTTLRAITHSLRGWPTPIAVAINTSEKVFGEDGQIQQDAILRQLDILAEQIVTFAGMQAGKSA